MVKPKMTIRPIRTVLVETIGFFSCEPVFPESVSRSFGACVTGSGDTGKAIETTGSACIVEGLAGSSAGIAL